MADNEEAKETGPRGNEWEVVSLTASAYAAAPGPGPVDSSHDSVTTLNKQHDGETSNPMFMSSHFVFPPSQHENLPIEPEFDESESEMGREDDVSQLGQEEGVRSDGKDEEDATMEGLMSEEFPGIQVFNEKGTDESIEPLGGSVDPDLPSFQKPIDEDEYVDADLPCEAWWKRRALSVYAHAKETNTVWSIYLAAAVMGLVIIGHQWQHERWQVLRLRWQFSINDEKMGRLLAPIYRLKDVVVGGHQRGSLLRGSASSEH